MTEPKPPQCAVDLAAKKCVPCEGGVPRYSTVEAESQMAAIPDWRLTHDATRIRRDWKLADFRSAIKMINNVAALAEREQARLRAKRRPKRSDGNPYYVRRRA